MEINLTHEQVKEYLTILDEKIEFAYKAAERNREKKCNWGEAMHEGVAIGYASARDILFALEQISERKKEYNLEHYETSNLPKCTLEYFIDEFEKNEEQ
jgi:hypothetical protein